MEDVAARAGVSRALVSIVFRQLPGASDASRRRVHEAADQLGYAPDQRARMLGRKRTRLIGVAFDVEHAFHGELVEALYEVAEARGYELALSAVTRKRTEDSAFASLLAHRCEALVLLGPRMRPALLDDLGSRLPLVVVARHVRSRAVDVVRTDDVDGARQATEHLIALGHRDIVHIDGGTAPGAAERRRGYRLAMRRAGLSERGRIIRGGLTEEGGAVAGARLVGVAGARLVGVAPRPTALFAFNDRCALGVMHAVADAGLEVPADVSVVGYDDSRAASLAWVDLTTVRQDAARLASLTVAAAIIRAETGAGPSAPSVVPPQLVVRGSSASAAQ